MAEAALYTLVGLLQWSDPALGCIGDDDGSSGGRGTSDPTVGGGKVLRPADRVCAAFVAHCDEHARAAAHLSVLPLFRRGITAGALKSAERGGPASELAPTVYHMLYKPAPFLGVPASRAQLASLAPAHPSCRTLAWHGALWLVCTESLCRVGLREEEEDGTPSATSDRELVDTTSTTTDGEQRRQSFTLVGQPLVQCGMPPGAHITAATVCAYSEAILVALRIPVNLHKATAANARHDRVFASVREDGNCPNGNLVCNVTPFEWSCVDLHLTALCTLPSNGHILGYQPDTATVVELDRKGTTVLRDMAVPFTVGTGAAPLQSMVVSRDSLSGRQFVVLCGGQTYAVLDGSTLKTVVHCDGGRLPAASAEEAAAGILGPEVTAIHSIDVHPHAGEVLLGMRDRLRVLPACGDPAKVLREVLFDGGSAHGPQHTGVRGSWHRMETLVVVRVPRIGGMPATSNKHRIVALAVVLSPGYSVAYV